MAHFGRPGRFPGFSGGQRNAGERVVVRMRALRKTLLVCAFGWLAACGGGGEDAVTPPPDPVLDSFTDVDRAASAAFAAQGISGMGLTIYDANGVKRFERM